MYTLISPFSGSFDEVGLIYLVPAFLEGQIKNGQIVEIPFRGKIEIGLVLEIGTLDFLRVKIDKQKIKTIISIKNEFIFLNDKQLELAKFIAYHYFRAIHNSVNLFFPKNLRDKISKDKFKIEEKKDYKYSFDFNKNLTDKQKLIFEKINKRDKLKFLLYGITGSGKTEIYIKLIKENLEKGKQSLLLIPEIILTNQLAIRLKDVFGEDIIVLNSTVAEAKKTKFWQDIYLNNAKIIIGTRSALFYPYNNLGLIIIDEEHDNSYVSDNNPRYKAIEVAEKITELNGNKLLLASGTPSINSMYRALKGEFELLNLLEKFDNK